MQPFRVFLRLCRGLAVTQKSAHRVSITPAKTISAFTIEKIILINRRHQIEIMDRLDEALNLQLAS